MKLCQFGPLGKNSFFFGQILQKWAELLGVRIKWYWCQMNIPSIFICHKVHWHWFCDVVLFMKAPSLEFVYHKGGKAASQYHLIPTTSPLLLGKWTQQSCLKLGETNQTKKYIKYTSCFWNERRNGFLLLVWLFLFLPFGSDSASVLFVPCVRIKVREKLTYRNHTGLNGEFRASLKRCMPRLVIFDSMLGMSTVVIRAVVRFRSARHQIVFGDNLVPKKASRTLNLKTLHCEL